MTDPTVAEASGVETVEAPVAALGAAGACVFCGLVTVYAQHARPVAGLKMNGRPVAIVIALQLVDGAQLVEAKHCPGCFRAAIQAYRRTVGTAL